MPMFKCLQINLNRSYGAQNLLMQMMAEHGADIGIVSEPNNCPSANPLWLVDVTGLAAIVWKTTLSFRCVPISRGRGYVVARCGDVVIASCYLSPNIPLEEYSLAMEELSVALRRVRPSPVLLAGDFNARSPLWGCNSTTSNAEYLWELMAALDMRLINNCDVPTCVRPQGSSVVDLVWTTAGLRDRIRAWRVLDELESLSDHRYLEYEIHPTTKGPVQPSSSISKLPRWAMKKFCDDKFEGAMHAICWNLPTLTMPVEDMACTIEKIMTDICDFSAPRVRYGPKKSMYWWNAEIAGLRRQCNHCRRRLTRANRRGNDRDKREARRHYREARRTLRKAIWNSKRTAWGELLDDLERDPWGRPYKMVVQKMRSTTVSATEVMTPRDLETLLSELFPPGDQRVVGGFDRDPPAHENEHGVVITEEDVRKAFKGKKTRRTAPGPDGICKEVWLKVPHEVMGLVAHLFRKCLAEGVFPKIWKVANLVLIPKPVNQGMPPKYRPICLLNDIGKALERIVAERICSALRDIGGGLSSRQFGFREGLSTMEALFAVRDYVDRARDVGHYVVAVSLDIQNAFNSLPWSVVLAQLHRKGIPAYLIKIIRGYFSERSIIYKDSMGMLQKRIVLAGVPQGSVLGPLLWNIAYDWVLEVKEWAESTVICYADDTLVLAQGRSPKIAAMKATVFAGSVVFRIKQLGLKIAAHKTEAILFGGRGAFPEVSVNVEGERVVVGSSLKHLGVFLDRGLTYKKHFNYVEGKALKMIRLLWKLLPNLRGPSAIKRQLYAGVLNSVMLYASPLWSDSLMRWVTYRAPLLKIQRQMALRVISGYRTVSYEAAMLLARMPPIHLVAARQRRIYLRLLELKWTQEDSSEARLEIWKAATLLMRRQWYALLDKDNIPGARVREAILPILDRWLDHRRAGVNFYVTQLLSGHGCFGQYLHRIGKRNSSACPDCEEELDTPEHVLEVCPRWRVERTNLRMAFEEDLPLRWVNMMPSALNYEAKWMAIANFAREVLTKREVAEREAEMA